MDAANLEFINQMLEQDSDLKEVYHSLTQYIPI